MKHDDESVNNLKYNYEDKSKILLEQLLYFVKNNITISFMKD
jgi:hypothetical protein